MSMSTARGYFEPSVLEYMDAAVAPAPIHDQRVSLAQQGRHLWPEKAELSS
jgi:hypothetical protein